MEIIENFNETLFSLTFNDYNQFSKGKKVPFQNPANNLKQ